MNRIKQSVLELLGLNDIKMKFSRLMASTATALDKLQDAIKPRYHSESYEANLIFMMRWLKIARSFFICSLTLADYVELRIEANNDNEFTSRRSQKKRMKQKKRKIRKGLKSLLVRVEDIVRRILDDDIPLESVERVVCDHDEEEMDKYYDLKPIEVEMDKWYTRLSDYLRKYSTSPEANQYSILKAVLDIVLENLKNFASTYYIHMDCGFFDQILLIKSLIVNNPFLINFIQFDTLLYADSREFQYSVTQVELLAIGAAQLTLHLFSIVKEPRNSRINPSLNEACTPASHNPTLEVNDYPFVNIMEDFVVSLLSTLWRKLNYDTISEVSLEYNLQTVFRGLRLLRIILKNQPCKFDDGKIRDTAVAAICDAGVIIFSVDRTDVEIRHANEEFSKNIQVIQLEVIGCVLKTNFPRTNVAGFLDFLLEEYMEVVKDSKVDSDILSFVSNIQEYLVFLKSFVGNLLKLRNRQKNALQDLWNFSIEVAYKIESLIDQLVLGDTLDSFSRSLQSITEDVMSIKTKSLIIFDEGSQDIIKDQEIAEKVPSIISSTTADEVVGFESEKASIIDQLLGGSSKLKVVSVVGMPGSGKTTLATKVFEDSRVTHYFYKMALCSISQVFDQRKVLLELLNQTKGCESESTLDEVDLSQQLWRSLKGYRYLIFIDDIWDTKAFDLLIRSLPDDSNKSRILLTSRVGDVVPETLLDGKPLFLRHLTMDESFELLHKKLFPAQKDWPSTLYELRMEIAEYCKGLPLTLVIIAGFLKYKEQEGWKDVLKTLRSSTISDLTVRTIELSYTHLPDHLKPLFLWFSAYPEDHEILVKEIIRLWIFEGLVRKFESKSPEEVARGYINILIARGLVMVAGVRSVGGVKSCRIHDLLRDFCLRKANEEIFLHRLKVDANKGLERDFRDEFKLSPFYEPELLSSLELRNMRRLCIYSKLELREVFCPHLRSLLFFGTTVCYENRVPVIFHKFKLLRVLDIRGIEPYEYGFPRGIAALSQLRYLAIQVVQYVDPAIGNLSNLEILILYVEGITSGIKLPNTIWNLQKLRHLCTDTIHLGTDSRYSIKRELELPISSCNLVELETLSILCCKRWSIMKSQLKKFPNIRHLGCSLKVHSDEDGHMYSPRDIDEGGHAKVVDFSFLSQLDSLYYEMSTSIGYGIGLNKLDGVIFPENIKRLTLKGCQFPWSKMSSIAKLPHLAVLKLLDNSFDESMWNFEEEEFPNLKFLKLECLKIVKWTAASNEQFPNLEKLVLSDCRGLQEIPEDCIGNVETLKAIEVIGCQLDVVRQVRKIEETQKDFGTVLQVLVRDIQ